MISLLVVYSKRTYTDGYVLVSRSLTPVNSHVCQSINKSIQCYHVCCDDCKSQCVIICHFNCILTLCMCVCLYNDASTNFHTCVYLDRQASHVMFMIQTVHQTFFRQFSCHFKYCLLPLQYIQCKNFASLYWSDFPLSDHAQVIVLNFGFILSFFFNTTCHYV